MSDARDHAIVNAFLIDSWKYSFTVYIQTDDGRWWCMDTGGDCEDAYRFDATSTDWEDHGDAFVRPLNKKEFEDWRDPIAAAKWESQLAE